MLRAGGVAGVGTPHVANEPDGEEAEEEAGDLEPQETADPAEGAEEASQTAAGGASEVVGAGGRLLDALRCDEGGRRTGSRLRDGSLSRIGSNVGAGRAR